MACISYNIGAPTNYPGHHYRRSPQSFAAAQLSFSNLFNVGSLKFESLFAGPRDSCRFESAPFCNSVFNSLSSDNGVSGENLYYFIYFILIFIMKWRCCTCLCVIKLSTFSI